jgi:DNA-binding Xre family transcriptional regulator
LNISRQKIELLQARKGLGTVDFAAKAGVSRQNISTLKLRGTCRPVTAARLAAALGVDVAEIIEEV